MDISYILLVILPVAFLLINYSAAQWGWKVLAEDFKTPDKSKGKQVMLTPIYINQMRYRVAVLHIHETGLYLSVFLPFQLGHPNLFIPWSKVMNVKEKQLFFKPLYEMTIKETKISVRPHIYELIKPHLTRK